MANNVWVAKQKKTAQVNTITPASVTVGNTFSVTINLKSITFTATGTTVAGVVTGLVALLEASEEPEFAEITWTDSTTCVTATADDPGKPFTQTSSSATGSGSAGHSNVTATTTANTSPSDVNDALNWSAGTTPATGEDVYIDGTIQTPLLWNLGSLSAQTLATLNISLNAPQIGLPELDEDGTAYTQYRGVYFAIGATICNIGTGGDGNGLQMCKLNFGSVQTTTTVFNTGSPSESNRQAVTLKGTHASNLLIQQAGSVGIAVLGGELSTFVTIHLGQVGGGSQPTLVLGPGLTNTTINQNNGSLLLQSAITTLNHKGASSEIRGSGAITTINQSAGSIVHKGTGTVTTYNLTGGQVDFGDAGPAITVSACKLFGNCQWYDKGYRVAYTAGLALQGGARLVGTDGGSVLIDIGPGRTYTPT